jgi:hypothetical protein
MADGFSAPEAIDFSASLTHPESESGEKSLRKGSKWLDEKPMEGGYYGTIFRECIKVRSCLGVEEWVGKIENVL